MGIIIFTNNFDNSGIFSLRRKNIINQSKSDNATRLHVKRENRRLRFSHKKAEDISDILNKYPDILFRMSGLRKKRPDINSAINEDLSTRQLEKKSHFKGIIVFPENLCFQRNGDETIKFLEFLNESANILKHRGFYFYIQSCQNLHVSVALVLTALLKKIFNKSAASSSEYSGGIVDKTFLESSVAYILHKFGCLKELRIAYDASFIASASQEIKSIEYKEFNVSDIAIVNRDVYRGMVQNLPEEIRQDASNAIQELTANSREHAYPKGYAYVRNSLRRPMNRVISIMGAYDSSEHVLYVGVYDCGIGIVNSIKRCKDKMGIIDKLHGLLGTLEERYLEGAFRLQGDGSTSTGDVLRGNGLGEVVPELVNTSEKHALLVYTGNVNGLLTSRLEKIKVARNNHMGYLQGTLMYFKLDMNSVKK